MFCQNCGSQVTGSFCPNCGTAQSAPPSGSLGSAPGGYGSYGSRSYSSYSRSSSSDEVNVLAIVAAVILAISTLLPYVKVSVSVYGYTASKSEALIKGDGWLFLSAAAVAIVLAALRNSIGVLVTSVISTALMIFEVANWESNAKDFKQFGEYIKLIRMPGFYLMVVGSLMLLAAGITGLVKSRSGSSYSSSRPLYTSSPAGLSYTSAGAGGSALSYGSRASSTRGQDSWVCNCGKRNLKSDSVCAGCGKPNPDSVWRCACGFVNSIDSRFCNQCGEKKPIPRRKPPKKEVGTGVSTWTCPKCGKINPLSSRVCMDCEYYK